MHGGGGQTDGDRDLNRKTDNTLEMVQVLETT